MSETLWPLVLYSFLVLFLVAAILAISSALGERHSERATGDPYESGMMVTGSPRVRLNVNFFLIAVFFVIFDLETVFIFGWAVALREVGWAGYVEIVIFIAILFVALFYLWRVRGLELRTSGQVSANKDGSLRRNQ
ncbi:MAG: NADH-quinone oxidoreductase subunit A [Deltaproteobacteria bacterium]